MTSEFDKFDKIFRRVLNDQEIFDVEDIIFNKNEWSELRDALNQNKIQDIKERIKEKNYPLCKRLLGLVEKYPEIFRQMLEYLDCFGDVKCNLPNMDDYGKVIERYSQKTAELYFRDKIKREKDQDKKQALKRVLNYVKELYNANLSPLEIAYFVRKLESLAIFWEVSDERTK